MKELFSALVKAQGEMGAAIKGKTNPHFRSKYADLASIIEAVREPFAKNGLGFIQKFEDAQGGVRIATIIIHESGQEYSTGFVFVPAQKADPQGYMSAVTYARRYSLQTGVGLPTEDDDGNAATESVVKSPSTIALAAKGIDVDRKKIFDIATSIKGFVMDEKEGEDRTYAIWELVEGLSNEDKLGLWEVLASNEKARVKKIGEQMKQAATASNV